MTPEDYVSYPLALMLKKAGFDLEVNHVYWGGTLSELCDSNVTNYDNCNYNDTYVEDVCSAPTLWQAQKWLREVKELIIYIKPRFYMGRRPLMGYSFYINEKENRPLTYIKSPTIYDSYEEALSAGIAAVLELI